MGYSDTRRQNNAGGGRQRTGILTRAFLHTGSQDGQQRRNHAQRPEPATGSGIIKVLPAGASFTRHFFSQRVRGGMMINREMSRHNHQYHTLPKRPPAQKH